MIENIIYYAELSCENHAANSAEGDGYYLFVIFQRQSATNGRAKNP
jgi:hypothetical protein